ncbi:extracellular matrix protein 3-like [Mytilus edulis]|uniref:extracellular matrix protein 3-like n=1 Tax=Mytilus edulis TaxID=6550 RepID=UPI0039F13E9D
MSTNCDLTLRLLGAIWNRNSVMFFLWILVTFLHTCCSSASEVNRIITNNEIIVPHGRSFYVNPDSHLTIHQKRGEQCSVTVLQNDPLSQLPGKLFPSEFPCNFGPKDVKYTHFGSTFPSFDKVRLLIRIDSSSNTQIIPVTLSFRISFRLPFQVVLRNLPLTIEHYSRSSDAIRDLNTQFNYDRDNQICKVSVLSGMKNLPRYGYVVNNASSVSFIDCDQFLKMNLQYKHTSKVNSPNKDYIPLVLELLERDGTLVNQEYFLKEVEIKDGLPNSAPRLNQKARLAIETTKNGINQFIMTAISPKILSATDAETVSDRLIFNVTHPLGPNEGEIVSTDDQNIKLHSFYQKDIIDLKIAYKPPNDDSNIPRTFELGLEIIDEEGLKSNPFSLMIIVHPKHTLAPIATKNTGLQLFEGQSRNITSTHNLQISDEDDLSKVKISVVDGTRHGKLVLPGGRQYFTPNDLKLGTVIYLHDGSDTHSDNIVFRMTDSKHTVEFLFPIIIFPVDDEPATLTVNIGLEIKKNGMEPISQFVLSASDIDSDDSSIQFILLPPYSTEGIILKRQFEIPNDIQNWQNIHGIYQRPVDRFTQMDILDNKLFYRHVGPHHTSVVIDKIQFSLMSGEKIKTVSETYKFLVKIYPVDDKPPTIGPETQLNFTVTEFQVTPFKRKNLFYIDSDTNESKLKYHITRSPFDQDSYVHLDAGQIVMCDQLNVAVNTFEQAEIFHQKICYRPPSSEQGLTERRIQFYFEVEDSSGNILPNQHFTITLIPVNNQPPIVTNMGATVLENQQVVLNTQVIDVQDPDSNTNMIQFTLIKLPDFGSLLKGQQFLDVSDTFSYADLFSGTVIYQSKDNDEKSDLINLEVTDGVHVVPIGVRITVKKKEKKPTLDLNGKKKLKLEFEVNEGGFVVLSSEYIKIKNVIEPKAIQFHVKSRAVEGSVVLGNWPTNQFTYQDVLDKKVQYKHQGSDVGYNGKSDRFVLVLHGRDMVGERPEITVNIYILPVDNITPTIYTTETFTVYEGEKERFLPTHLDVVDQDTKDENVQCIITTQPTKGYIENISPAPGSEKSRVGMSVTAFYIEDVRLGHMNYVQSIHFGEEPKHDSFAFKCTDGVNISPDAVTFHISIYPKNDESPKVFIREFIVMEGMELKIDSPILSAVDEDVPSDEITFIIRTFPQHGQIVQQRRTGIIPITQFTKSDIVRSSTIMYQHDNTESFEDSVEFIVTDGLHNVTQNIPIIIIPVDDETPRLTIHTGLQIDNIGDRKLISDKVLKAEDLDSHDPNITFIIRRLPSQGYFIKDKGHDRIVNMTYSANFTQFEIDSQQVYYIHTGTEGKRDIIKFDVTDGLNPLIDQYFYITIKGMDLNYPEVYNKGVKLPEGGRIKLTTDFLRGKDIESPDALLIFRVTKIPSHGFIYNTDNPYQPITSFTQLDLAGSKVCYIHNAKSEIKMDSFQFEVTDGHNSVKRTFRIAVTDVDNKKPTLVFDTLFVAEGGNKLISPFELKAVDEDTIDVNIEFVITQLPLHGNILYNYSRIITMFTNEDIKSNLITYQHDGTETSKDAFSFTVTDGVHSDFYIFSNMEHSTKQPQTIPIEIMPMDNGIPYLKINSGLNELTHLDQNTIGATITDRMLSAIDRDSEIKSLVYEITVQPTHGYILVNKVKTSSWTQDDINKRAVEYILNPNEDSTSDIFFFKIKDQGGNHLSNQPFTIQWCWVSFKQSDYQVSENNKYLEIQVQRRGYLGETIYVGITAENGTARINEDVGRWYAPTIQFNPGQMEKTWKIHLIDDERYEGTEYFNLKLDNPVMTVVEQPKEARVVINDKEDESVISFTSPEYRVAEDIGEIMVPIKRTGDLLDELMVICCTKSVTATGTTGDMINSGADYISRSEDHHSTIRFDVGEDTKYCKVTIIDDSMYEEEESFHVILMEIMGGRVEGQNWTSVVIEPDSVDAPQFFFSKKEYNVDESAGQLEISVKREGSDLSKPSSVTVTSRQTDPTSAEVGDDYVAVNKILNFPPGVSIKSINVTILDDLGQPDLEGPENYQLVLRMPMGGALGSPKTATVVIDDTISDAPVMEFEESIYFGNEKDGQMTAVIVRHGDLDHDASVRCYTRQNTATVADDYIERPDTDLSLVYFSPGQRHADCIVDIVNDSVFEPTEQFRLVLGSPTSSTTKVALVGTRNSTILKISNPEDEPSIEIPSRQYVVNEPIIKDDIALLKVPVVRTGDLSGLSEIVIMSKDGSAEAGRDYNGFSKALTFHPGISLVNVEIQILYDKIKENRETFIILLTKDRYNVAEIKNSRAMIYIEENSKMADVVFPTKPIVVSLKDYDDVSSADDRIINGYPVICVSSCNPKHPDFPTTGPMCETQEINDTLTKFQWQVAAPTTTDGVTSPLEDIVSTTFFASTRGITLDSVYFNSGSRIRCIARAVNVRGEPGHTYQSDPVKVSGKQGLCLPREVNTVGADPFTAKLKYLGPQYGGNSGKVLITVNVPHQDGMLPVVSTWQPSNFEFILSPDALRQGQHQCSNLIDFSESRSDFGFVSNRTKNPFMIGEIEPYQNSADLRTAKTLRFYSNLDYESCQWKFQGIFDMTSLVTVCEGKIAADGQPLNIKQSFMTMRLPLYVSYVYHALSGDRGWRHIDTQTELEMTFVYNTAVMWDDGISSSRSSDTDGLEGSLFPASMKIINNRLVVTFRTKARFRGQFVMNYPDSLYQSSVSCIENPKMTFTLRMLRSSKTYDKADQLWQFESDFSMKDYSGLYKINLVPCTTSARQAYDPSIKCQPQQIMTFDLPIRFQQVSDPVPSKYTLNAKFRLMRKRDLWLSENKDEVQVDMAFSPGDTLYGRIDSSADLGQTINLGIDKVFICSGKDGYIPRYDPENDLYGCLGPKNKLEQSLKILDPLAPDTVDTSVDGIQFKVLLARDDPRATSLVQQPGADGFSIDTQPLFEADNDRVWFLHSVYSLKTDRQKRDLASEGQNINQPGTGTNMIRIRTTTRPQPDADLNLSRSVDEKQSNTTLLPVLIGLSILLIIILILLIFLIRRHKKRSSPPPSPTSTITVVDRKGKVMVVHLPDSKSPDQRSEV